MNESGSAADCGLDRRKDAIPLDGEEKFNFL